ncbi:MAG: RNA-binding S4 domain-containing protein [Acholeplasmataceae bacterium]|jgi:ribosomal 50S subunit-recycling heat shock protein|nr:RNA-binding S4 domain-containing protein [Acholeplasmataceae bacterium]
MRLDKYLKTSRLIKRRVIAKEASDKDLITINDKVAKPASLVKIGDILTITLGNKIRTIKITSLNQNEEMFILLKEEKRM